MDMEKTRTTVKIAGREYALSSFDSKEYMHRVAIYVDRKLQELSVATRLPGGELAVLTAVNIADDMLKAQDENNRLRKELMELRQELLAVQKDMIMLKSRAGAL